jgi:hypothetical protein
VIKIKKYPKIDKSKYLGIYKPYCGGEPVIFYKKSEYVGKEGFIDAATICSSHFFQRNTRCWNEKMLDSVSSFNNEKDLFKWLCANYKNEDKEQDTIGFITSAGEKGFCVRQGFDCGHVYGYLSKNINDLNSPPYFSQPYAKDQNILCRSIVNNFNVSTSVFKSTIGLYQWLSQ